jgi:PAS domain S-box-containing protein
VTASLEDQAAEARHLRRLLDSQPGCLMRIASTGEILAANDAAVEMLGAEQRKFALGVSITKWIVPDQIGPWKDFVARVVSGVHTSLETHLVSGDLRRKALFHGTPLTDHPDRVSSLLVAVHDISERMVLEAAIEQLRQSAEVPGTEQSTDELDGETEVLLDEWVAEQDSLQERFDRLAAEHATALTHLDEAMAEQRRLEARLSAAEAQVEHLRRAGRTEGQS